MQALRGTIDAAAVAADRITLDREAAQLELLLGFAVPGSPPAMRPVLPVAGGLGAPASNEQSVREAATAVEALVTALGDQSEATRSLLSHAGRLKQAAPPAASLSGSVATATADATAALRRLIAAVIARAQAAGNQDHVQRATALQQRLDRLPSGAAPGSEAIDPLMTGLLQALRAEADPRVRSEAARLVTLARVARGQAASGIDPAAFDQHRGSRCGYSTRRSRRCRGSRSDPTSISCSREWPRSGRISSVCRTGTDRTPPPSARDSSQIGWPSGRGSTPNSESAELRLRRQHQRAAVDAQALQSQLDRLRPLLAAVGSRRRLAESAPADEAQRVITALIGAERPTLTRIRCRRTVARCVTSWPPGATSSRRSDPSGRRCSSTRRSRTRLTCRPTGATARHVTRRFASPRGRAR